MRLALSSNATTKKYLRAKIFDHLSQPENSEALSVLSRIKFSTKFVHVVDQRILRQSSVLEKYQEHHCQAPSLATASSIFSTEKKTIRKVACDWGQRRTFGFGEPFDATQRLLGDLEGEKNKKRTRETREKREKHGIRESLVHLQATFDTVGIL